MRCGFVTEEVKEDDDNVRYIIDDSVWMFKEGCRSDFLTNRRRYYGVRFNRVTQKAVCDCCHFETHGIMCRHIIRVLYQNKITIPPEMYVLHRWKKNIHRKHQRITVAYHDPSRTKEVRRIDRMQLLFDELTFKACLHEVRIVTVEKVLKRVIGEIESLVDPDETVTEHCVDDVVVAAPSPSVFMATPEGGVSVSGLSPSQRWSMSNITQTLRDPVRKKKRGRPKGSRNKSEAEKEFEKSRAKKSKCKGKNVSISETEIDNEEEDINDDDNDDCAGPSVPTKKITRSMTVKGTSKKCKKRLDTILDKEVLLASNNMRYRDLEDSSDDNSMSF